MTKRLLLTLLSATLCLTCRPAVRGALGERQYVSPRRVAGTFTLASQGVVAPIYVDTNDFWGVQRAAGDLQTDFRRVAGRAPQLITDSNQIGPGTIIVGTLGKNPLLDRLIDSRKISGKWESFLIQVV